MARTRIVDVTPGDHNLLSGDDVTVAVTVDGKGAVPDTCELVYDAEGEETQMAVMHPAGTGEADDDDQPFRILMADASQLGIRQRPDRGGVWKASSSMGR